MLRWFGHAERPEEEKMLKDIYDSKREAVMWKVWTHGCRVSVLEVVDRVKHIGR